MDATSRHPANVYLSDARAAISAFDALFCSAFGAT
jgi:hypothetical protein